MESESARARAGRCCAKKTNIPSSWEEDALHGEHTELVSVEGGTAGGSPGRLGNATRGTMSPDGSAPSSPVSGTRHSLMLSFASLEVCRDNAAPPSPVTTLRSAGSMEGSAAPRVPAIEFPTAVSFPGGYLCEATERLTSPAALETNYSVDSPSLASSEAAVFGVSLGQGSEKAENDSWICAICHRCIPLAEIAHVKGCEHPYCANCILQWCSYKQFPWCPQCRLPFDSLLLFRKLDGSLSDALVEESVCLLLRAPWYTPVEIPEDFTEADEVDAALDIGDYDEEEYFHSTLRLGNRRWGENGYVRGGRMQARIASPAGAGASGSSSNSGRKSSSGRGSTASKNSPCEGASSDSKDHMGRRAKRAQKREEVDKREEAAPASGVRAANGSGGRRRRQHHGPAARAFEDYVD